MLRCATPQEKDNPKNKVPEDQRAFLTPSTTTFHEMLGSVNNASFQRNNLMFSQ
jgi:hypothetical protein